MVIDIGARRRLRQSRWFLAIMVGTSIAGIVWDDMALFALTLNATIWILWYLHKSSLLRELDYDTESLSLSKEDTTKHH